jgi:hypothetical protein
MSQLGQARSPRPDPNGLLARQMNHQIPDAAAAAARMIAVCRPARSLGSAKRGAAITLDRKRARQLLGIDERPRHLDEFSACVL